MLVFIDESGDSGLKIGRGSSRYFTVGLVVFEDHDEALACDERIGFLRKDLGWKLDREFHFKNNSEKVRCLFLRAVSSFNFFYYGIVINKDPEKLYGEGFRKKSSFYKYTCSLVFENAKHKLDSAIVVVDRSGSLDFRNQLAQYLRRKMNRDKRRIKAVKMQRSESNNLIQLADYVSGVINRSVTNTKKKADDYRKIIAHREKYVQIWPK